MPCVVQLVPPPSYVLYTLPYCFFSFFKGKLYSYRWVFYRHASLNIMEWSLSTPHLSCLRCLVLENVFVRKEKTWILVVKRPMTSSSRFTPNSRADYVTTVYLIPSTWATLMLSCRLNLTLFVSSLLSVKPWIRKLETQLPVGIKCSI